MLKAIKKALLLSSCISSFIFPMRQIPTALLARTLNQAASFHSSPPARCPIVASLFIVYAIIELERIDSQNNPTGSISDKNKDNSTFAKDHRQQVDLYKNIGRQKIPDLYAQADLYKDIWNGSMPDLYAKPVKTNRQGSTKKSLLCLN